jgi:hypothetical protein
MDFAADYHTSAADCNLFERQKGDFPLFQILRFALLTLPL